MKLKLIAGIGNPEPEYAGTRHNLGFEVVRRVAARLDIELSLNRFLGRFGMGKAGVCGSGLLLPGTYVNNSGFSVKSACDYLEIAPSSVLVVTDDLNLATGKLRFRQDGSSGGHNGLKSVIEVCGSERFPRLRIGIGSGKGDVISHVLGRYEGEEKLILDSAVEKGADTALSWLKSGVGKNIYTLN